MSTHKLTIFAVALLALGACKKEKTEAPSDPVDPAPKVTGEATAAGAAGLADSVGSYKLDPVHSAVTFKVGHMGVSHTLGRFNKVTGELRIGATPAESSVAIEVAADSVFTADKKRDEHLKSPDFLNAAQFPSITFQSTKVEPAGDGRYEIAGDLTLHGQTREVTAVFEHVGSGKSMMDPKQFLIGFTGELAIKRTDFGMKNMVGPAGDEIDLLIAIEAVRQ
jgi:polyisoprenoid-binding protein YceI